jgi:hypothetical protein
MCFGDIAIILVREVPNKYLCFDAYGLVAETFCYIYVGMDIVLCYLVIGIK